MATPTPMLAPSPMDISGLFSGAFNALRRRFGTFALLTLLPSLITLAIVALGVVLLVSGGLAATGTTGRPAATPLLIVGFLVLFAAVIAGALLQLKSQAMMCQAAYEVAQGQQPTIGGLFQRTRGYLPRIASLIALGFALVILLYGAIGLFAWFTFSTSVGRGRDSATAGAGFALLLILFMLALIPLGVFFSTKLIYTVPAVTLENLGGIDGLRRSWRLTRGSFWRTLGYYLVASIAVAAVSGLVSAVSQAFLMPFTSRSTDTSTPAEAIAALTAIIPMLAVSTLLQLVVQLFGMPFLQSYVTYMFLDQVRRSEMPPQTAYGYPQPSAPYYAQPQQGYPAQGYGTPPPAQYPGQPYPGQQSPGQPYGQQYPGQPPQGQQPQYPGQPYPGTASQQTPAPGQPASPQQASPQQASPQPGVSQQPHGSQYPRQGWPPPQNPGDDQHGPLR